MPALLKGQLCIHMVYVYTHTLIISIRKKHKNSNAEEVIIVNGIWYEYLTCSRGNNISTNDKNSKSQKLLDLITKPFNNST